VIENLFRKLTNLFLARHLFENGILQQLLLNQVRQLQRRHLEHLNPLAELGR
jgi:hypothetical protein